VFATVQPSRIIEGVNPAVGAVVSKTRVKGAGSQKDFLDLRLEFDIQNGGLLLPVAFPGLVSARVLEMDGPSGFLDTHLDDRGCPSGADEQHQEAGDPKQRVGPDRTYHGNSNHRPDGVNGPVEYLADGASAAPHNQGNGRPSEQGKGDGEILNHDVDPSESDNFTDFSDWQFEFVSRRSGRP